MILYLVPLSILTEPHAIASEFGNSAKIIVPRGWLRKRVIAFLHSEFISRVNPRSPAITEERKKVDEQ